MTTYSIRPISRVVAASPHDVFMAFIDPDRLTKWFAPNGCQCVAARIEPELDGKHLTVVEVPDGSRHTTEGEFVEFATDRRLVMTWRYIGPTGADGGESLATVDLTPSPPNQTVLTIGHDRLDSSIAVAGVREGWSQILSRIESALPSASAP